MLRKNINFVPRKKHAGIMKSFNFTILIISAFVLLTDCTQSTTTGSAGENSAYAVTGPEGDSLYQRSQTTAPEVNETATSGEIYIAVEESLAPVIKAEVENFQAVHEGAVIHTLIMPGEEAIRAMLISDSIRLVVSSRMLDRDEENLLRAKTIPPDYATIFKDGIVLVNHPENPARQLTFGQLTGILNGTITKWKDINPDAVSLGDISLVFDHARSGTIAFLKDSIMADKTFAPARRYAMENTSSVFNYVSENRSSIGVVGFSWISDQDDPEVREVLRKVKVLFLERSEKDSTCAYDQQFFGPYQSFLDQECYPLTRKIYTISRESGIGLGTGFVAYLDGPQGQRIIHKAGLASIHTIPRRVKFPDANQNNTNPVRQKPTETIENPPDTDSR